MNEELQKKLLDYLGNLETGIEKAIDFGSEQAPLVIQEIIHYHLVYHTISAAFVSILAIVLVGIIIAVWKRDVSKLDSEDVLLLRIFGTGIPAIILIPMISSGIVGHAEIALKCWLAPRLFILEYLSDLVK